MRTNVVLNALLGRYSAFCPLNVASGRGGGLLNNKGEVKIHTERKSKSSPPVPFTEPNGL